MTLERALRDFADTHTHACNELYQLISFKNLPARGEKKGKMFHPLFTPLRPLTAACRHLIPLTSHFVLRLFLYGISKAVEQNEKERR